MRTKIQGRGIKPPEMTAIFQPQIAKKNQQGALS